MSLIHPVVIQSRFTLIIVLWNVIQSGNVQILSYSNYCKGQMCKIEAEEANNLE